MNHFSSFQYLMYLGCLTAQFEPRHHRSSKSVVYEFRRLLEWGTGVIFYAAVSRFQSARVGHQRWTSTKYQSKRMPQIWTFQLV
eukprot:08647_5